MTDVVFWLALTPVDLEQVVRCLRTADAVFVSVAVMFIGVVAQSEKCLTRFDASFHAAVPLLRLVLWVAVRGFVVPFVLGVSVVVYVDASSVLPSMRVVRLTEH